MEQPIIIRVARACELLDVSRPTIQRMIARGDLPEPVRANRRLVFWTKAEFERAVKKLTRNK